MDHRPRLRASRALGPCSGAFLNLMSEGVLASLGKVEPVSVRRENPAFGPRGAVRRVPAFNVLASRLPAAVFPFYKGSEKSGSEF